MKTNKKVWATSLCAILLGITVYSGYHTYNKYQEINESLLTLRDVEAMAGGETGGANGKQYHKDNPLPDWIPYIGGTSCEADFAIPYDSKGMENHCEYTGNEQHSCDYYRCRKNG